MQYCWPQKNKHSVAFALFLLLVFLIGKLTNLLLDTAANENISGIIYVPFGILGYYGLLRLLFFLFVWQRKYQITPDALLITYPFGMVQEYPWDCISEIAICKLRYNKKYKDMYSVGIRFVIGTEFGGPMCASMADEPWSTEIYEYRHWKKIISIEYSDTRYAQLRTVCPNEITDCRYLKNPDSF